MLVLDSSALIGLERELADRRVGRVRAFLGEHMGEDLACSTVTVGELASGGDETAVRVLLRRLRKLPVSEAIAYAAGTLDKDLMKNEGQRVGENDARRCFQKLADQRIFTTSFTIRPRCGTAWMTNIWHPTAAGVERLGSP